MRPLFFGLLSSFVAWLVLRKDERPTQVTVDESIADSDLAITDLGNPQAENTLGALGEFRKPNAIERERLITALPGGNSSLFPGSVSKQIAARRVLWFVWNTSRAKLVDIYLIEAVMRRESNYDPGAFRNEANVSDESIGLLQVRIDTAQWTMKWWNKSREEIRELLFDPYVNVWVGATYLLYQQKRYGNNADDIASAYNAGSVKRLPDGRYINQAYVNNVIDTYQIYRDDDHFRGVPVVQ